MIVSTSSGIDAPADHTPQNNVSKSASAITAFKINAGVLETFMGAGHQDIVFGLVHFYRPGCFIQRGNMLALASEFAMRSRRIAGNSDVLRSPLRNGATSGQQSAKRGKSRELTDFHFESPKPQQGIYNQVIRSPAAFLPRPLTVLAAICLNCLSFSGNIAAFRLVWAANPFWALFPRPSWMEMKFEAEHG